MDLSALQLEAKISRLLLPSAIRCDDEATGRRFSICSKGDEAQRMSRQRILDIIEVIEVFINYAHYRLAFLV